MADGVGKKRSPSIKTAFREGPAYIAGVSTGRERLELAASIHRVNTRHREL
jgi:hypothetical protein